MDYTMIAAYDEFSPNMGYPSIRTDCRRERMPRADEVIAKLMKGDCLMASPSYGIDCFTGERLPLPRTILHDDTYCWSNAVAYYIDKHNLHLPSEIVEHFLKEA